MELVGCFNDFFLHSRLLVVPVIMQYKNVSLMAFQNTFIIKFGFIFIAVRICAIRKSADLAHISTTTRKDPIQLFVTMYVIELENQPAK